MIHIPTDLCNGSCETFSPLHHPWNTGISRQIAGSVSLPAWYIAMLVFRISLTELPSPARVLLWGGDAPVPRGPAMCLISKHVRSYVPISLLVAKALYGKRLRSHLETMCVCTHDHNAPVFRMHVMRKPLVPPQKYLVCFDGH